VGVDLVEHTMAQTALITAVSPEGRALRDFLSKLISTQPAMALALAEKLSGIDVGIRVADTRDLLFAGKAVLLAPGGNDLKDDAGELGIDLVADTLGLPNVTAALLRPDGYVWWSTEDPDPVPATREALRSLGTSFR